MKNWQKRDADVNWHPYTQHKTATAPIVIKKAKDALLWDVDGKEYIDAIGSWWCNPHGHANTYIANAIFEQINELEHVLFGGFTHPMAIQLSERLLQVLPENQAKIFYSDNGSTAIEVAIKMALQYHHNRGEKKDCIIAIEEAFHGDTFAAMAASGLDFFTQSFSDFFLPVERIPLPTEKNRYEVKKRLEEIFAHRKPAAFVYEALVQGASGMKVMDAEVLSDCISFCRKHGALAIADEVMTGFGRTGKLFASEHLSTQPDIMAMSKALTGGFIPMAATSCTQEIYDAFWDSDMNKAFFHGHTFMANPAGCAAAMASIDLCLTEDTCQNIERIHQSHSKFAEKLKKYNHVENIHVLGVILRFDIRTRYSEVDFYGDVRNKLYTFFLDQGVLLRPVGNSVYILPPYCITPAQLQKVYSTIEEALMLDL